MNYSDFNFIEDDLTTAIDKMSNFIATSETSVIYYPELLGRPTKGTWFDTQMVFWLTELKEHFDLPSNWYQQAIDGRITIPSNLLWLVPPKAVVEYINLVAAGFIPVE